MAMNRKSGLYSLLVTAILLAVGIVLPFLTGNVQVLGQAISPLHIPVLICGLTCGWCWGMGLGIVLPLLRSVLFGMPPAGASRNSDGIRNGSVWRAVRAALSDAEQEDEQDLLRHADCHGGCHACGVGLSAARRRRS